MTIHFLKMLQFEILAGKTGSRQEEFINKPILTVSRLTGYLEADTHSFLVNLGIEILITNP